MIEIFMNCVDNRILECIIVKIFAMIELIINRYVSMYICIKYFIKSQ